MSVRAGIKSVYQSRRAMPRLRVHTIDQPDCDITAFVLSCNRLHLLKRTLQSFLATRDLPTRIVIVDDSGLPEVFEQLVKDYGQLADIVCFPENRGIWWAKDFMTSFCATPYIFYVEEDWLFLNTGYLAKSKAILEKHREIGSIDISWRTFEDEGCDTYTPELVDGEYFHKKPWQISEKHLHWFCWHGSPNLKRREDLILLGRVEKFYNEWNVDRKFFALGLRGVFLKDRYVTHLGDYESLMKNKRPNEHATPESLYPESLLPTRTWPVFDYYYMDRSAKGLRGSQPVLRKNEICLVTCLLDIDREKYDNRNFAEYYFKGIDKLLELGCPLVVFVDSRYYESLLAKTGGKPISLIPIAPETVRWLPYYNRLCEICESTAWVSQADWMANSIIRSPEYVGLTLHKLEMLRHCVQQQIFLANRYYWIDAGICNSFQIESLQSYDFTKIPGGNGLFMSTFPYRVAAEMHGYAARGFKELCGSIPDFVCRATLFGGTKEDLNSIAAPYDELLQQSLIAGYIGTEEALFSGLALKFPALFDLQRMPNGDIRHCLTKFQNTTQTKL